MPKLSLFVFIFCFLLFGCSKSSTTTTTNVPAELVGKWTGVSYDLSYTVGGGQTRTNNAVAVTQPLTVQFNDDGTYSDYGVFDITSTTTNNKYSAGSGTFLVRNDTIRIIPVTVSTTQSSYAIYKVTGSNIIFTINKPLVLLSADPAVGGSVSSFEKYSIVYTFKKS